jgi:dienelactone hydrolase
VKDIMETVRTAVELPELTGKVALQGYCLGALMAFREPDQDRSGFDLGVCGSRKVLIVSIREPARLIPSGG